MKKKEVESIILTVISNSSEYWNQKQMDERMSELHGTLHVRWIAICPLTMLTQPSYQWVHCTFGHIVDRQTFQDRISAANPYWSEFTAKMEQRGQILTETWVFYTILFVTTLWFQNIRLYLKGSFVSSWIAQSAQDRIVEIQQCVVCLFIDRTYIHHTILSWYLALCTSFLLLFIIMQ